MTRHELDRIDETTVSAGLSTRWLGRRLFYYPVVGSTNDLLKELAARGEPAGSLVLADYQFRGKGRQGRRWLAPPGTSLLFSLLFRPEWPPQQVAWLTMMTGLATVQAVQQVTGLAAALKWPNDLVLWYKDQWCKVGGLLAEADFSDQTLNYAVLGCGINVNMEPEQLPRSSYPAMSLSLVTGYQVNRVDLLASTLFALEELYLAAQNGHSPQRAWSMMLITIGRLIDINTPGKPRRLQGIAEGTDEWGRLLVRDHAGDLHALSSGDVTLSS